MPQAADATVEVELPDGRQVQAYEFDVPLRVVALRGSVPGAWCAGETVCCESWRLRHACARSAAD